MGEEIRATERRGKLRDGEDGGRVGTYAMFAGVSLAGINAMTENNLGKEGLVHLTA